MKALKAKGVEFNIHPGFDQDELGIWTAPDKPACGLVQRLGRQRAERVAVLKRFRNEFFFCVMAGLVPAIHNRGLD